MSEDKKLRVALFFTWDVSLALWEEKGLLQREIRLYQALAESGDVDTAFLSWGGEEDRAVAETLAPAIETVSLYDRIPRPENRILRAFSSSLAPFAAYRTLRDSDLIKTNQMWGGWVAVLAKFVVRRPLLVRCGFELYDFTIRQGHGKTRRAFVWLTSFLTYSAADHICVATQEDKDFVIRHFRQRAEKITVHPNWIDTEVFRPLPVEDEENAVLYVGRLSAQKNLEMLIEALAGTEIPLHIAGEGELHDSLESLAQEKDVSVRFLGRIPNDELPALYNKYPVFVLPSHYEGNPKTLLEAMACGRAAIGADSPGISSVITDGESGVLCQKTPQALREAILRLAGDGALRERLGQGARAQILENNTLARLAAMELEAYRSLTEDARKKRETLRHRILHFSNKIARRVQKGVDRWAKMYWHDFPFGRAPKAARQDYLALWEEAKSIACPEIDAFEKEKGFAVDPAWFHDLALHTQIVVKDSSLCYQHGRVLYAALRDYVSSLKKRWDEDSVPAGQRMVTILETGTARGFSAVCMARALSDADICGKIVTFDLLPHTVQMYWNCIDDHDGAKSRQELLAPWRDLADPYIVFMEHDSRIGMARTATGRVNFAFLDGAHTYEDVMIEFDMVRQRQQEGDVIVFDDYNAALFPGIIKGVDEGCEKWGYEKAVFGSREGRAYVVARKQGL